MYRRYSVVVRAGAFYACVCGLVVLAIMAGGNFAFAASEVAQTISVKSTSTASGRVLQGADIILERDRIDTSASGEVQLEFLDDSRVLVGPSSSLGIQDYLASANRAKQHVGVIALGGAVRFISGNSGGGYTIKTPTATIGVRGTQFDVAVTATRTAVLVYEGNVRLCSVGRCVRLRNNCDIGVADGTAPPSLTTSFALEQNALRRDFPYAYAQRSMPKEFRVNAEACVKSASIKVLDSDELRRVARPIPVDPAKPTPPKVDKPHKQHKHHGRKHDDDRKHSRKHDDDRKHGRKHDDDRNHGRKHEGDREHGRKHDNDGHHGRKHDNDNHARNDRQARHDGGHATGKGGDARGRDRDEGHKGASRSGESRERGRSSQSHGERGDKQSNGRDRRDNDSNWRDR